MLNKTPLLHQSFGPRVLLARSLTLSLSFSLSLPPSLSGWSPGVQRLSEFTFLPGLLRPSWEGALCLHPIERAPEASVNKASPIPGALLAFCINQGISASFSFTFLLVDSRPPGSSPLKDLNKWRPEQELGTHRQIQKEWPQGLLRPESTKTWVKWLERPITFVLYFITYLKIRDLIIGMLIFS